MNLIEIFHHLSDPFESVLPVLKSWTRNFNQWQRHLFGTLLSISILSSVSGRYHSFLHALPLAVVFLLTVYLNCCHRTQAGPFGQQQLSMKFNKNVLCTTMKCSPRLSLWMFALADTSQFDLCFTYWVCTLLFFHLNQKHQPFLKF